MAAPAPRHVDVIVKPAVDPSQIYYAPKGMRLGMVAPKAASEQINASPTAAFTAALDEMYGYFG